MKNYNLKLKIKKTLHFAFCILHSWRNQGGQVVLMLVLITIVGLTIGLSLVSRTVTDIRISSQIEQSRRAFSAAEAGIESALKGAVVGQVPSPVNFPDASGTYSVAQIGNNTSVLSFPVTFPTSSQTVWLIDHNDATGLLDESGYNYPPNASFDICWGTDANITPAIVISLFYKSGTAYRFVRTAYDKNGISRGNNFAAVDSAGNYCDTNYRFKKTITPTSDFGLVDSDKLLFMRVQPIYENTTFAIKPSVGIKLPGQGKVITSVGQTNTGVVRKIQVSQGYSVLPTLLNFTVFAETKQ